jgi:hypothetical protein
MKDSIRYICKENFGDFYRNTWDSVMVMIADILRATCLLRLYFVLHRKIKIHILGLHICNSIKEI